MDTVDITIIGAGVIGLSIASEITKTDRTVLVLEKNNSWGQEASSRNSEVIHAGIYYQAGSLKAISCVEGREMLYELCKQNAIPAQKTGKIIVAVEHSEIDILKELYEKAKQNGVEVIFLDKQDVYKKEPAVSCLAALYSPETGIVDSHSLMKFFLDKAESYGADLVYDAEVTSIKPNCSAYKIEIKNAGEDVNFSSRVIINCAGLNADKIASWCGIDAEQTGYKQHYLKGNYFRISDKFINTMRHLVYPVPQKDSLGIHTVLDLQGGIKLGPDAEEVTEIDYRVNEGQKEDFYESVKKFLPSIEENDLSADMAGIRPQLKYSNSGDFRDFIIEHEDSRGLPGLINLIGVESPGLTASSYIGKYVADIVEKIL
ncbi:MAG: NAD(P)/FAD-dependent oxidoreductase [Candidatus Omnitrophica bacterium]|nr:NAD(P)/FAD-dependent oxidoreductase [Candidatus Omnitrophota bacterium]